MVQGRKIISYNPMLCSEIIYNFSELENYKEEWNRLVSENNNNIFLTWEWVSTWWEFFGKGSSIFVILVKDESNKLVGIAPLKINSRKILGFIPIRLVEFIGFGSSVSPEYLDFIISKENSPAIIREAALVLMKNKESWDVLNLSDMDGSSSNLPVLKSFFSEERIVTREKNFNVCPYLSLPVSWDELLDSYSHNMRRTIRRTRKRFEGSTTVKYVLVEESSFLPQAFEQAARLHRLSRQKKGEKGNFHKKNYLAFHLEFSQIIAQKGWLYLAFLMMDECPIAFRYGYLYNQKYYDYQTGYDPKFEKSRIGWVLVGYVMQDLIKRSIREFDFLRGGHEYKWHWAKSFRKTIFFRCFRHNLPGLSLFLWWEAKEKIKRLFFSPEPEVPYEKD